MGTPFFMRLLFGICLLFLLSFGLYSQEIRFYSSPEEHFGFDIPNDTSNYFRYKKFTGIDKKKYPIPIKSVARNESDEFYFSTNSRLLQGLKIFIKNSDFALRPVKINDTLFVVKLPNKKADYQIFFQSKMGLMAIVQVQVLEYKMDKVLLVPLQKLPFSEIELEKKVNELLAPCMVKLDFYLDKPFETKVFTKETILHGTDTLKRTFTGQMRSLRDAYFEKNKSFKKQEFVCFLVPDFSEKSVKAYAPKGKALGFCSVESDLDSLARNIVQTYAFGKGKLDDFWRENKAEIGSRHNVMDVSGNDWMAYQWKALRQDNYSFSYFDDIEQVKTNNGLIAYYFWEEGSDGAIHLKKGESVLSAIKRPYKKNFLSYRFNVKYAIFKPFYKFGPYYLSFVNIVFFGVLLVLFFYLRRRIKHYWQRLKKKRNFLRRLLYLFLIAIILYGFYGSFALSNDVLDFFKVISGPLPELENLDYQEAKREVLVHPNLRHKEYANVDSEILVHRGSGWEVKKRSRILYFDVIETEKEQLIRFVKNSDSLILDSFVVQPNADNHYLVFSYYNREMKKIKQEIYNHLGIHLTDELKKEDPVKKILVFVNGYRPTSTGSSFEENFSDILSKGLEYQNSKNFVYDFDRYNYWEQWGQINLLFADRFNPDHTFYADGHFSVSTSNHRSLVNFSNLSNSYPKRCSNPKLHSCYRIKSRSLKNVIYGETKSSDLLKLSSNKRGFNYRKLKGRIAGKNLLQMLNEFPNTSSNDTLFIVAHSMGFAYAQGMIEMLRGKIHFGTYLIIAPENAKAGKVDEKEWKEVWKYGSNFSKKRPDAPCLLDGVAPQTQPRGLSLRKTVYIPQSLYYRKGFFDSHFIGYYTWILKIKPGKPGFIHQH